jgi:hypothetical protein
MGSRTRTPLLVIAVAACAGNPIGIDAGPQPEVPPDGGGFYGGPGEPVAQLRFGSFVAALGPVDFCVSPHATSTFEGPLLAGRGDEAGLGNDTLSLAGAVPGGQLDVRVVAGGSASCATPLSGADFVDLPPLLTGNGYTALLVEQAGALTLTVFPDDAPASVPAGQAAVRVISVAASGPTSVDVGQFVDGGFVPWIGGLPPLAIPQAPGFDSNGYLQLPPQTALPSLQSGGQDLLDLLPGVQLSAGAQYSLFALSPTASQAAGALFCVDDGFPSGTYAPCLLFPQPGEPATSTAL